MFFARDDDEIRSCRVLDIRTRGWLGITDTTELIDRCWRACYHDGDVAAVKSFLASGVDINARAPCSGAAPLDAAIYGGHVDLIRYLVNAGANVNGVGYEDATALMAAAYQGDADTARLLLARGADPLVVHTGSGESPSTWLACTCHV